jgi:hypothetical protein
LGGLAWFPAGQSILHLYIGAKSYIVSVLKDMKRYRTFLIIYAGLAFLMTAPFLLNLLFIRNAGEDLSFSDVVRLQRSRNALYGTAMNQNIFVYKLELVKEVKPEIIALGPSTVAAFREESFNVPFVNCANAMNDLTEGKIFIEEMLKHHKPKVVILGPAYWWFSDQFPEPKNFDYHKNMGSLTFEALFRPFEFLWESKITLGDYFGIILYGTLNDGITNYEKIGLRALKRSEGFRRDGTALPAGKFFGFDQRPVSIGIEAAAARGRFQYGQDVSARRKRQFEELLELLRKEDIRVVVVVQPVSTRAEEFMTSRPERYGYVEKFREYLKTLAWEVYDFHSLSTLQSNDCECTDAIHLGDVLCQRILLKIHEENPDSALKGYLKVDLMKEMVKEFAGRVLTVYNKDLHMFNYREVDFLKIGCRK